MRDSKGGGGGRGAEVNFNLFSSFSINYFGTE